MKEGRTFHVLRPNRPAKMKPTKIRVKPTWNWASLLMVGSKGWPIDASQMSWSGFADIYRDVSERVSSYRALRDLYSIDRQRCERSGQLETIYCHKSGEGGIGFAPARSRGVADL